MALANSFQDSFNAGSISGSWSTANAADATQVLAFGGGIEITHTATSQYNALTTASTYDLTGNGFFVQVQSVGNQALVSHETIIGLNLDASNSLWMGSANGQIYAWVNVATVHTQVGSSKSYIAASHRWWRIRESLGTIYYDTAPDGKVWTNQWNTANPFAITAISPYIQSGNWQNEASGSFSIFDNYNTNDGLPNAITPLKADGMSAGMVGN